MFRNKLSKVASWPYFGSYIYFFHIFMLFVLVVWVILHLNVVHSLDFKRSGMDIWFQTNSLFLSFWYTMLHFRQSYPVTLCFACFTSWDFMFQLPSLDKYLSTFCYSMYKDKQLNQTLCHIILSYINFLQKREKNTSSLLLPKPSHKIINQVIWFPPKPFPQHSWEMKVQKASKRVLSPIREIWIGLSKV